MSLTAKQSKFLELVRNGDSVFLTGKAGTGKSHVVKMALAELRAQGRKVVALAPTGIAANNIGGQTLHSFFSLPVAGVLEWKTCNWLKNEKRRLLENVDTIFIDEVSMLRPDQLDGINWTLIKNGARPLHERQVIFCGDLAQLLPPIDDNTRSVLFQTYHGEEFHFAKIYDQMKVKSIELDEVMRQNDPEFISNLNIIREGKRSEYFRQFVNSEAKGIVLAPHNTTVDKYNTEGLAKIDEQEFVFDAVVSGNAKAQDFSLESKIRVKHGARIMYLVNSTNGVLFNGTLGTFCHRDGNFFIEVGGVEYKLEEQTITKKEYVLKNNELQLQEIGSITQYPFKLAYALSIHKSQGLTFDEVTLDLTRACFAKGQMYVALSRVKSPQGLRIITK